MHRSLLSAITLILVSYGISLPVAAESLEKRVMQVAEELRCLVCQNQTIADSQADLAIDLKNQVREKLAQGMTEKEVISFMVQRYGDFVLYRPPVKSTTWVLWFGPFFLLLSGFIFLFIKLRQRQSSIEILSAAEIARAAELLAEKSSLKEFQ
ncbi:MAG: cytochrome c-type biogenesis protein [Pseudomonadota bacterium]